MLFNERYKKFHIGNICDERFRDIWASDRYWEVMNYIASSQFNAQRMCGSLCLQHNEFLDSYMKDQAQLPNLEEHTAPIHLDFV